MAVMASKSWLEQILNQTLNKERGKFRACIRNDIRKGFMPIDSLTFYSFVENSVG